MRCPLTMVALDIIRGIHDNRMPATIQRQFDASQANEPRMDAWDTSATPAGINRGEPFEN